MLSTPKLPLDLKKMLQRFAKVPDGGWLIDKDNVARLKGRKGCHRIFLTAAKKKRLEKLTIKGEFKEIG